ncbi:P-loop containing nucleoside triphosphate hydrolase protein [Globomyces pollinis-pini]|nr:P-loop containing nucleoside triphosphate hydrolase protein [Globomyces pollinis-pini]
MYQRYSKKSIRDGCMLVMHHRQLNFSKRSLRIVSNRQSRFYQTKLHKEDKEIIDTDIFKKSLDILQKDDIISTVPNYKFENLGIKQHIIDNLKTQLNIHEPSADQQALIPIVLSHSDLLLKNITGSGKTLGLVISILSKNAPSIQPFVSNSVNQETKEFIKRRLSEKPYLNTLFMVPTRELALQIFNWISILENNFDASVAQCVVNGIEIEQQQQALKEKTPKILIGTPNRILELYEAKSIDVSRLQTIVVDEIDRVVSTQSRYSTLNAKYNRKIHPMPAEILLEKIISQRKQSVQLQQTLDKNLIDQSKQRSLQLIISSATLNNPTRNYLKSKEWFNNPIFLNLNSNPPITVNHQCLLLKTTGEMINVKFDHITDSLDPFKPTLTLPNPKQVKKTKVDDKLKKQIIKQQTKQKEFYNELVIETISSICFQKKVKRAFIFIPSTESVARYVQGLQAVGLKAEKLFNLHDYNTITHQSKPFEALLDGRVDIIVATEFEARGLDLPDLNHVFIIGVPEPQSYLHMSGRTGRFGKFGTTLTIVKDDYEKFKYLSMMKHFKLNVTN